MDKSKSDKPDVEGTAARDPKAHREMQEKTVSEPGGYANDPDIPTNPNEAIERHRRTLRR